MPKRSDGWLPLRGRWLVWFAIGLPLLVLVALALFLVVFAPILGVHFFDPRAAFSR